MSSTKDSDGYLARLRQIQDADAARLDAFRQADQDRKALFEEVLHKYQDLAEQHRKVASELNYLKLVNRNLDNLKYGQNSNSLVGVFIDGDGSKFHENLIKDGVGGGELAAHKMKDAIKKELKEIYPGENTDNWQIIVWYITALDGLASVYQASLSQNIECSGVNFRESLRRFAIGVNRGADYNFNFIDVGGGKDITLKEITDAKLRETFKMMLPHCRHVFFSGCHDEGYVSFLSPYKLDQKIAPKITLIETHGTRPKFYELRFRMTKFPGIFRMEDFSRPPTSYPPTSPTAALQEPNRANDVELLFPALEKRAPMPVISSSGASSWASSARSGLPPSSRVIDITPAKRASDGSAKQSFFLVNTEGERVDEPLPRLSQQAKDQLDYRVQKENGGKNFCNQCNFFGPETCDKLSHFRHGKANLTGDEELALRHKVRGSPCSKGSWCKDAKCPYGHNCRFRPNCTKPDCKFSSLHHVNGTASRKVFEDGSSKLIPA